MSSSARSILPYVLKPLSWAYGAAVEVRNWLFDHNILPNEEFNVPVVSVGNITVGGTGKTPHVEYLAEILALNYKSDYMTDSKKVAVLSRGYKRKTRGFILANAHSTPETIGDEPLQIYNKLGDRVLVAVCENRRQGIKELLRQFPDIQVILLDDGFQHRYVKPRLNILLMDYHRPIYSDKVLPLGRLREAAHQTNRADMVVVTKCPATMTPLNQMLIAKQLNLMKFQKLYYSTYAYGALKPVFPHDRPFDVSIEELGRDDSVLLVSGVANPRGFIKHFNKYSFHKKIAHFPDHHDFTRTDVAELEKTFLAMRGERKIIITTEKDAVRLAYNPYFPTALKPYVYYIPITVQMIEQSKEGNIAADILDVLGKHS